MSLVAAITPRDVGRDREDEHGEQAPEPNLRQGRGELNASLDPRDRGETEHEGRPEADVPVPRLAPGARGDRRQDRGERRRLGMELAAVQGDERRHEEDPAAHAEQAGDDAGEEPEQHGEDERGHVTSSRTPMTTRNAANASARKRERSRCWSAVPPTAPTAAGSPTSAAYFHSTSPWNA